MGLVSLRDVQKSDLPLFFEQQNDHLARHMAAFTSEDPSNWPVFAEHWSKILDDALILKRSIMVQDRLVGHVVRFVQFGAPEVSYWVERAFWGRGIATEALRAFLMLATERPLYARAAKDNVGSRKVLEKNGFAIMEESSGFAHARQATVEEWVFVLFT